MTAPTTRTEGAADGLREAVAQALRGPFEPRMDHRHQGADAAIAAVRAYDAAHRPAIRITLPDGFTHVGSNDAPPAIPDVTVAPQPVPHRLPEPIALAFRNDPTVHACLIAHRHDYVAALEECIPHLLRERDRFRDLVIKHAQMAPPQPVPVVATGAGWVACSERMPEDGVDVLVVTANQPQQVNPRQMYVNDDGAWEDEWGHLFDGTDDVSTVTHWMPLPPAPGAPAAQATVPAGGGRDLFAAILDITEHYRHSFINGTSERHYLATELTRLGYGLGGGLSKGARETSMEALDFRERYTSPHLYPQLRQAIDRARAEIEALPRVGVRT